MNDIQTHPARELSRVRAAICGQPWAITQAGFRQMCTIVEAHISGNPTPFEAKKKADNDEDYQPTFEELYGFSFTDNEVAVIPVSGTIFPKANLMTRFSGATSLQDLQNKITAADALSPASIILNIDSPGGSVMGLANFCSWLHDFAASSGYPVIGIVNDLCASAAYMIGSQLDVLYSVDGGMSGSIGVISFSDNWDRADRNQGNDPVLITSHPLKGIGYGPISQNQTDEIKREVEMFFSKFQEAVSRGRPQVDLSKVSTGQVWMANPANDDDSSLALGLVDAISTLENLIEQYGKA